MAILIYIINHKSTTSSPWFVHSLSHAQIQMIEGFFYCSKQWLELHCKRLQGFTGTLRGFSAISAGKTL